MPEVRLCVLAFQIPELTRPSVHMRDCERVEGVIQAMRQAGANALQVKELGHCGAAFRNSPSSRCCLSSTEVIGTCSCYDCTGLRTVVRKVFVNGCVAVIAVG